MVDAMKDRLNVKARFNALVGAVTIFIGTRLARRAAKKKMDELTPGTSKNKGSETVPNKTKPSPGAMAARATLLVAAARPIVQRAMNDPELRSALQHAFETGRDVTTEVRGKSPKKSAQRIERDKKILERVEISAAELQKAVKGVMHEPEPKKGFFRRVVTPVLVMGGVAAAVFTFMKKRGNRGIGPEETPY
jgi:hypothetical protein